MDWWLGRRYPHLVTHSIQSISLLNVGISIFSPSLSTLSLRFFYTLFYNYYCHYYYMGLLWFGFLSGPWDGVYLSFSGVLYQICGMGFGFRFLCWVSLLRQRDGRQCCILQRRSQYRNMATFVFPSVLYLRCWLYTPTHHASIRRSH